MKRRELLILVLVLGIAAGMRLIALDQAPPGMLPQEAIIGNAAVALHETGSMPDGFGRDVPFVHLQAFAVSLFGASPEALRVLPAVLGLLTILGTYLLARRLFDQWQIAAISAFLMAVGFWPVHMSRIAVGAPVLAAFTAVWGFYSFYKGVETHRLWYWGLAGAFLGRA
jgi:4-amino-4-deoxy-L-arabinose transferase-like glycosyltransferase